MQYNAELGVLCMRAASRLLAYRHSRKGYCMSFGPSRRSHLPYTPVLAFIRHKAGRKLPRLDECPQFLQVHIAALVGVVRF